MRRRQRRTRSRERRRFAADSSDDSWHRTAPAVRSQSLEPAHLRRSKPVLGLPTCPLICLLIIACPAWLPSLQAPACLVGSSPKLPTPWRCAWSDVLMKGPLSPCVMHATCPTAGMLLLAQMLLVGSYCVLRSYSSFWLDVGSRPSLVHADIGSAFRIQSGFESVVIPHCGCLFSLQKRDAEFMSLASPELALRPAAFAEFRLTAHVDGRIAPCPAGGWFVLACWHADRMPGLLTAATILPLPCCAGRPPMEPDPIAGWPQTHRQTYRE
mmetsp:Transcript_117401/g.365604  ORF Transcript_117401/g.365604 Transcript_117401/m.365604 type:complete len:269 (-) Transcript_117401:120-926(-)